MKILVLDDNPAIRRVIKLNLQKLGHTVADFSNGEDGLTKLRAGFKPDLVITDIMMPVMNGFDFIREFRADYKEYKNVPIIVISAKKEKTDVVKAIQMGANDYIIKPFNTEELLQKVKKI